MQRFRWPVVVVVILAVFALVPTAVSAQTFRIEAGIEELTVLDDTGRVPYRGVGVAVDGRVASRIGLGVGVSRLIRRHEDRLLMVEARGSVDLGSATTTRVAVPFIGLSAGLMHQSLGSSGRRRTSQSFVAGVTAGIRLRVGDRWFVAPWAGVGVMAYPYRRIGIVGGRVF